MVREEQTRRNTKTRRMGTVSTLRSSLVQTLRFGEAGGGGGGGGGAYDEELDLFRPLPPPEVLVSRPSERQINRGKCL